jgi:hypothetical protein
MHSTNPITVADNPIYLNKEVIESKDVQYYRSKRPWPMQDRDYVLNRRSHINPALFIVMIIITLILLLTVFMYILKEMLLYTHLGR